jgi:hypothetical protein
LRCHRSDLKVSQRVFECCVFPLKCTHLLLSIFGLFLEILDLCVLLLYLLDKLSSLLVTSSVIAITIIPQLVLKHLNLVLLLLDPIYCKIRVDLQVPEALKLSYLASLVDEVIVHQVLKLAT